jgi:hypothetical protein
LPNIKIKENHKRCFLDKKKPMSNELKKKISKKNNINPRKFFKHVNLVIRPKASHMKKLRSLTSSKSNAER